MMWNLSEAKLLQLEIFQKLEPHPHITIDCPDVVQAEIKSLEKR